MNSFKDRLVLGPVSKFFSTLNGSKDALFLTLRALCNKNIRVSKANATPEFHGNPNYGGWAVLPSFLSKSSVIYSVGVGEDISFDLSIIRKFGCAVYAFDPTPRSKTWLDSHDLPFQLNFFPFGLAHYDGTAAFYPPKNPSHVSHSIVRKSELTLAAFHAPVFKVSTLARMFGHTRIDLLKMDIEGAEYEVIDDIISQRDVDIRQILVEFHPTIFSISESVNSLKNAGYRAFWISKNKSEVGFVRI